MLNPQNLCLGISLVCLVIALSRSLIMGIWDSIEDDFANDEDFMKDYLHKKDNSIE